MWVEKTHPCCARYCWMARATKSCSGRTSRTDASAPPTAVPSFSAAVTKREEGGGVSRTVDVWKM